MNQEPLPSGEHLPARVVVVGVDMPMGALVTLMLKCAIAAIPAALLLLMLWGAIAALLVGSRSAWGA